MLIMYILLKYVCIFKSVCSMDLCIYICIYEVMCNYSALNTYVCECEAAKLSNCMSYM